MESPDEILRLPGKTPRARQRKHCSVIASKKFRQLDWIMKEFLRFSVTVRASIFLGKLTGLHLLTCTPSRPHHHKSHSSMIHLRAPPRAKDHIAYQGGSQAFGCKALLKHQSSLTKSILDSDQSCGVLVARDALFLCCRGFAQDLKGAGKACSEL
jgi:hypothetical protein